ncbi:MAG: thioesterase [Alistipes sp.]|nr:thioesterase [Alistipes sp.]
MAEKTSYVYEIDPQRVDYTMRATISSMTDLVLSVAGIDAQIKGFGTDVLNKEDYSWVLLRMAVEYDKLPMQFTKIRIYTWVNEYGRMMSTRNFTIEDMEGNELGRVVTQWCMINLTTRRPVDLSLPAIANTYGKYIVEESSPIDAPQRLGAIEADSEHAHKVVYSDIDFNRHVNTLRYIDMMLDVLPIEIFAQQRKVRMDINFQRECRYGQTLNIAHKKDGVCDLFDISADGASSVRARFEWRE